MSTYIRVHISKSTCINEKYKNEYMYKLKSTSKSTYINENVQAS